MRGRGRCRQLGARAQGAGDVCGRARALARCACAGRQAGGRAGARRAGGRQCAAGRGRRAVGRGRTRGRAQQDAAVRGRARQARAAWAAWARPGRAAGPGWGFVHSDSVFLARFDSVVS